MRLSMAHFGRCVQPNGPGDIGAKIIVQNLDATTTDAQFLKAACDDVPVVRAQAADGVVLPPDVTSLRRLGRAVPFRSH